MQDFRRLNVWQAAMRLARAAYVATDRLPREERYGLTAQIRRSALSVPSNLAEGCGRNSRRELVYFVGVALGSLHELETQIELAADMYSIDDWGTVFEIAHETKAKLLRFRSSVRAQVPTVRGRAFEP